MTEVSQADLPVAPAHRVEKATPPDRNRAVDAMLGLAILGVVLGHWLVSAVFVCDGHLLGDSPLRHMPALTPLTPGSLPGSPGCPSSPGC